MYLIAILCIDDVDILVLYAQGLMLKICDCAAWLAPEVFNCDNVYDCFYMLAGADAEDMRLWYSPRHGHHYDQQQGQRPLDGPGGLRGEAH
jgi:hypothetical protein